MRAHLARGQIRRAAVLQVGLAGLPGDVHAVVRRECAERLGALPPDASLRADEDRRRPGLLVGPAVAVRALDGQDELGVAVLRVDVGSEGA